MSSNLDPRVGEICWDRLHALINDVLFGQSRGLSEQRRAVKLFELQVLFYYPLSLLRSGIKVEQRRKARRMVRAARRLAAIRLIEDAERDLGDVSRKNRRLADLARDPITTDLYDKVLAKTGGWPGIRYSPSAREFHETLQERREVARPVSDMIDFSWRFDPHAVSVSKKSSSTMARFIVGHSSTYHEDLSRSTIVSRWKELYPTAIFLYLLGNEFKKFTPKRITHRQFTGRLLAQLRSDDMVDLFAGHNAILKLIQSEGYSELAALPWDLSSNAKLAREPLPPATIELLREYDLRSADA